MIIVAGQMELTASVMEDFAAEVRVMRPKVLREEGCGSYSLLVEDADQGLVNVLEFWDSDASLAAHLKQPWIKAFLERFGPHLHSSTVRVYDVSGDRALPGG